MDWDLGRYARGVIPLLCVAVICSACFSLEETLPQLEDDNSNNNEQDSPSIIAPSIQVEEAYYRGLYPFISSNTRGQMRSTFAPSFRLDAERQEMGMLEIAQDFFATTDHLFREGQIIEANELENWLANEEAHALGLNPSDAPSDVLMHVMEHNYWDTNGERLQGVVIGLALALTYTVQDEVESDDGTEVVPRTQYYTEDELRRYGVEMGNEIVHRLRGKSDGIPELADVPIIIALYQMEERQSLVPGNFLSVGEASASSDQINNWTSIDESYYLFPSSDLNRNAPEISQRFDELRSQLDEFFPHFIGLIGNGRFIDEQLVELTLRVNTEYASKTEVMQITQYVGSQAMELFGERVQLNLYIEAMQEPQAVFVRTPGEEPIMHVYR